jgi:type II secretory pathway pseudopilin PulG
MERITRVVKALLKHVRDTRGATLYEITAAVAMTGILAAVAVPVVIERTTEAKVTRVVTETESIAQAITAFQGHTGLIPGAQENLRLLLSGPPGFFALLPDSAGTALAIPGVSITEATHVCTAGCGNLNDYLVRDPNTVFGALNGKTRYPSWQGPYINTEVFIDQFDRAYIANVSALYRAEQSSPGTCGFAWVYSGGPDRILGTALTATALATNSDDIGKNNGKKLGPGNGCKAQ